MYRPRVTMVTLLAPMLLTVGILTAACSGPPEEQLLRRFFRASQLRDSQTLANFAAATFDAKTDGIVSSFDITTVSEERAEPLRIRELAKAYEETQAAEEAFSKRKKEYQDANIDAINRILKAESAKKPVSGKDAAVQATWNKWRDDTAAYAKKVSEARNGLANARPVPELSLMNTPGGPEVDLTKSDGEIITKEATLDADVKLPDGSTTKKTLVVTLQRVRLKSDKPEGMLGLWVISSIKEVGKTS